jgi:hypothetical protein
VDLGADKRVSQRVEDEDQEAPPQPELELSEVNSVTDQKGRIKLTRKSLMVFCLMGDFDWREASRD